MASEDTSICLGHRGAAGHAPENTLESFQKAIELGTDWIELDVHQVQERLIVIHDTSLERTTNGTGKIYHRDIDYLRSLDAGHGNHIPYLQEVLDLADRKISINIEIKSPQTALNVIKVIDTYVRSHQWSYDQFLISSFNHFELQRVRALQPTLKIGLVILGLPHSCTDIINVLQPFSIHIYLGFIDEYYIRTAHQQGLKVYAYTVNFPEDIRRIIRMGADGVISDYPERVIGLRAQISDNRSTPDIFKSSTDSI